MRVYLSGVKIYETKNAGSIKKILALKPDGTWYSVYSGLAVTLTYSRIFSPTIVKVGNIVFSYYTYRLYVYL